MEDKPSGGRRWRLVFQWALTLAVLWFVFRRLATDWPTARASIHAISWWWLVVSAVPGAAYFLFRAHAWGTILRGWGVHAPFAVVLRVWMKAEVLRFLPGTVWALLGRVTQAATLGVSKSIVGITLLQEAVVMLFAAAFVAAAFAIPVHSSLVLPGPIVWICVAASVLAALLLLHPRGGALIGRLAQRVLRRGEFALETLHGERASFPSFCVAWVSFALFQYVIALSFGFGSSIHELLSFFVAFLAGWILGYVTVFAPSGLGVREAVVVAILTPSIGATEALVVAALTRLGLVCMELLVLFFAALNRKSITNEEKPVIQ